MIRFDAVTFAYHGADVPALRDASFALDVGELIAVVGPNGSGKSTLAMLANGLLQPASGSVTVDGYLTTDGAAVHEIRRTVGVVFQRPEDQIVATTVEDDVAFGPENLGLPRDEIVARVGDALAVVGLTGMELREPHLLSGGQKQRLALAGALAMRPQFLVFDEVTSMLDPEGRADAMEGVRRLVAGGHGVLLITHDLSEVMLADRVMVLVSGEFVWSGAPSQLVDVDDAVLGEWGLETPPVVRMAAELARRGNCVDVADPRPERIAEALCR